MRICHITTAHPATDPRIFWRECVGLARLGHSVTLIAQAPSGVENDQGVTIRALRRRASRSRRIAFGWIEALRYAYRARSDIYHLHDPELVPLLVLLRLCRKTVVYDAHEWLSLQVQGKDYLHGLRRPVAIRIARIVEWVVRTVASEIFTVNESCREPFRPRQAVIVANYPDTDFFRPDPGQRENDGTARFVYVGGISIERGLANVITALEIANREHPTRLVLAGPIHNEQVRETLQALDGWRYVDYLGTVSYPAIPGVICRGIAGISVLLPTPNHLISSPIKIFEYLACGIPVIASDFPAWRSTFHSADAVEFVDPEPSAIAKAMCSLTTDPARVRSMGSNARELAVAQFSWQREALRIDSAYASLLGRQPRRTGSAR